MTISLSINQKPAIDKQTKKKKNKRKKLKHNKKENQTTGTRLKRRKEQWRTTKQPENK